MIDDWENSHVRSRAERKVDRSKLAIISQNRRSLGLLVLSAFSASRIVSSSDLSGVMVVGCSCGVKEDIAIHSTKGMHQPLSLPQVFEGSTKIVSALRACVRHGRGRRGMSMDWHFRNTRWVSKLESRPIVYVFMKSCRDACLITAHWATVYVTIPRGPWHCIKGWCLML